MARQTDQDSGLEQAPKKQPERSPQAAEVLEPAPDPTPPDSGEFSSWPASDDAEAPSPGAYHAEQAASSEYENQNLYGRVWPATAEDVRRLRAANPNAIGPQNVVGDPSNPFGYPPIAPGRRRDPAVMAGSHPLKVPLAREVRSVKTGTPLTSSPAGWIPTTEANAECIAATYAEGGTSVNAWLIATLETYYRQFISGRRYSIADVDDYGNIVFLQDDTGPHLALTDTQILLDLTRRG